MPGVSCRASLEAEDGLDACVVPVVGGVSSEAAAVSAGDGAGSGAGAGVAMPRACCREAYSVVNSGAGKPDRTQRCRECSVDAARQTGA